MNESPWVNEKLASEKLGVTEDTLRLWREIGYLKPGTHWRSSPVEQQIPWTPKVLYHLRWCEEIIDYWNKEDAAISRLAA
tara:strand:- start:802 stop:1041 length:240 start_codon:yes stop_codon:yes gene_type:complete